MLADIPLAEAHLLRVENERLKAQVEQQVMDRTFAPPDEVAKPALPQVSDETLKHDGQSAACTHPLAQRLVGERGLVCGLCRARLVAETG